MTTLYHIGISGGKDSTALLLWAIHKSGVPWEELRISFSNTKNEHDWTYWYVRQLSRYVRRVTQDKVRIKWLQPEKGFYELAHHKKRFPSQVARFCTEYLKLEQTRAYIKELQAIGYDVIALSGVRDSEDRAIPRREFEPACSGIFGVPGWNPLFTWSLEDVWAIHRRYNVPPNPLYVATQTLFGVVKQHGLDCIPTVLGNRPYREPAERVGCYPCINSRKSEIANAARNFPDRINTIREAERTMPNDYGFGGFFHQKKVPKRFHSQVVLLKALPAGSKKAADDSLFAGETITVTGTSGLPVTVPTIDDVVRWALSDADENETLDFETETIAARLSCARSGACE